MILISVSAHVKKYIDACIGSPITLSGDSTLHIILRHLLFKPQIEISHTQPKEKILPNQIIIQQPHQSPYLNYRKQVRVLAAANLFNEIFINDFVYFVSSTAKKYSHSSHTPSIITNTYRFCKLYNIEIDGDITLDAIIKIYQRRMAINTPQKPLLNCPFIYSIENSNLSGVMA